VQRGSIGRRAATRGQAALPRHAASEGCCSSLLQSSAAARARRGCSAGCPVGSVLPGQLSSHAAQACWGAPRCPRARAAVQAGARSLAVVRAGKQPHAEVYAAVAGPWAKIASASASCRPQVGGLAAWAPTVTASHASPSASRPTLGVGGRLARGAHTDAVAVGSAAPLAPAGVHSRLVTGICCLTPRPPFAAGLGSAGAAAQRVRAGRAGCTLWASPAVGGGVPTCKRRTGCHGRCHASCHAACHVARKVPLTCGKPHRRSSCRPGVTA
jgi:hypothetical protein